MGERKQLGLLQGLAFEKASPAIQRARLKAAELYAPTSIPHNAILNGFWDNGEVVGQFLNQGDQDEDHQRS